jgi:hypothetical protein
MKVRALAIESVPLQDCCLFYASDRGRVWDQRVWGWWQGKAVCGAGQGAAATLLPADLSVWLAPIRCTSPCLFLARSASPKWISESGAKVIDYLCGPPAAVAGGRPSPSQTPAAASAIPCHCHSTTQARHARAGGGYVSQVYAIRQAVAKALVAYMQKCACSVPLCSEVREAEL